MGKEALKVGDRVAAYSPDGRRVGTVAAIYPDSNVKVEYPKRKYPTGTGWELSRQFHPKQLRRLKKRERRRIWISRNGLDLIDSDLEVDKQLISRKQLMSTDVEFVEVKRK